MERIFFGIPSKFGYFKKDSDKKSEVPAGF